MMRTQESRQDSETGSGMIEVLVLLVVMAVGFLSLAKMQALIMRDGGTANNRAIAISLAQEKIDALRSFRCPIDLGSAAACVNSDFEFVDIASSSADESVTTIGSITLPATFARRWTVTDYYYCAGAMSTTNCSKPYASLKRVSVVVEWDDVNGNDQQVTLTTDIFPNDSFAALAAGSGGGGTVTTIRPQVPYTAGIAPDVVPVTIKQGEVNKETSKPLPDVSSKGYSLSTQFETVTYKTGSPNIKQKLDDFVTLNCVCEFETAATGAAYAASYYYWDTTTDPSNPALAVNFPTTTIAKKRGTAPTLNGDAQHELCETCCRDHHDSTTDTTTALYDPYRPGGDYTGGDHKHYYYVDAADPDQGLQETSSGNYLEACRFLRVDGIYRLMQDWRAINMLTVPKNDYLTISSKLTAYQTYVSDFLRYAVRVDCNAASGTGCGDISQSNEPTSPSDRGLTNQSPGAVPQLLARAVYLDRVYGKNAPRTEDASYYTALASKISAFQSDATTVWLDRVPFNEVNVTLLASWSSADPSIATVTNENIADISATAADYYGVYSRGQVTIQAGSGGNTDITAYLLPSTSGLTGGAKRSTYPGMVDYNATSLDQSGTIGYDSEVGIDRHDHASSGRKFSSLNVSRAGTASISVTGSLKRGNSGATFTEAALTVSGTGGITCTDSITSGTGTFTCSVPSGYSGTFTIATTATNNFFDSMLDSNNNGVYDDGGFADGVSNGVSICTVSNVTGAATCGTIWVFGPTITVSGTCSAGGYATNLCSDGKVVTTTDGTTPSTNTTCASSTSCSNISLDPTTHTWTGTVGITSTQTGAGGKPSHWDADSTCNDGATSANTVKSTGTLILGPADGPGAYTVCVSDE
jgi:Tfp pilus assembly protein PilV